MPVFVDVLCAFHHGGAEGTEQHGELTTKARRATKNALCRGHEGCFASVEVCAAVSFERSRECVRRPSHKLRQVLHDKRAKSCLNIVRLRNGLKRNLVRLADLFGNIPSCFDGNGQSAAGLVPVA
jgi:hypothetical protein